MIGNNRVLAFWIGISFWLVVLFWNLPPGGCLGFPRGIAYQILFVWGICILIYSINRLRQRFRNRL